MFENFLIIMFAIAFVISVILLVFVFYQVPSIEQKIMQLLLLANWILTVGNIVCVLAPVEMGAQLGDSLMYIGGSFLTFSFFLIVATICKINLKKRYTVPMLCMNFLFALAVVFDSKWHLIYSDIRFYRVGKITYSTCSYGALFYAYEIWQCLYMVDIIILLIKCKKSTPRLFNHLKPSLIKFMVCCVFAYIPYILITVMNLEAEVTGICSTIAAAIFVWTVNKHNVFPTRVNSKDSIINELDDILLVTTVEGGFEYANEKAKQIVSELKYFPYGMKIEGLDSRVDAMIALMDDETLDIGDRVYRKKKLPYEHDGKHLGDIHWLRDETVLANYVNEIVQLKEEADRANEAKSTFLAHMSHEIRTPINGVLGLDEMLIREAKDSQTLEYANQIMRTGKMLLAIINDVLDFSKIEAGKMELMEAPYSPLRMIEDILLSIEPRADEKGLKINKDISSRIPKGLVGDETRVKQIITNLMSNAVKYTEVGEVTLKVDYINAGEANPDYPDESLKLKSFGRLFVSVADTGIGIRHEDMDKLYGSFERVENITTHKTEGTGLGMSISSRLLKLMGGRMKVKSEYGKGSVFSISVPQEMIDLEDIPGSEEYGKSRREALFTAKDVDILVVDDNKTNLVVAKGLLKRTLVNVEMSTSGPECLEKIQQKHYDLILLDHRMPDMDGIETFKRMGKMEHMCKGVPVVMMTADAGAGARDYYISQGMTEYISKPLNPIMFEKMVGHLLPKEKVTFH